MVPVYESMEQILKCRLRERGFDLDLIAAGGVPLLPQVSGALHVCKDLQGAICLTGVPHTDWVFDGVICLVQRLLFLVDKEVAKDWGILGRG